MVIQTDKFFPAFAAGNQCLLFFGKNRNSLFFILSKLLYFLLDPITWLLAGLMGWLVAKKWKRRRQLGWLTFIVFIIFSNSYLYRAVVLAWQPKVVAGLPQHNYQTAVLLSGMTYSNQRKEVFFGGTSDRFIQTALLYHTGHIKQIIISGGDGSINQERPKEALFLRDRLMELKVPAVDLITEPLSRNTYENAVACKRILDSLQIKTPILLITSAMHMRRAKACFEKQQINVVPFACNYSVLENPPGFSSIVIPDLSVLLQWKSTLKEMIGLMVYKMTGKA